MVGIYDNDDDNNNNNNNCNNDIASFYSYTCKSLETNLRDETIQHVMVECRPPVVNT